MAQTVTDRALVAAAAAARAVIDTELGEDKALAFLFTVVVDNDGAEHNTSVLVAAANTTGLDLPAILTGLVVVATQGAAKAGANVNAEPRQPHPFTFPPSMN